MAKFLGQKRLEMGPSFMRNSLQNFSGFLHKALNVSQIFFLFFRKNFFLAFLRSKRVRNQPKMKFSKFYEKSTQVFQVL